VSGLTEARRLQLHQFLRFLLVGVGNTAVSFVAYRLLLLVAVPYALAAPLAFAAGALNGYVFNRRWTFAARDTTRSRVLYVLFQGIGAASTTMMVVLLVQATSVGRVPAYLVAVPPVTVAMFLANRVWTFREPAVGDRP
jgi:putative flippase GtrA